MAKGLDGLIHHLLDQVALCGEHGALPSDFISQVKGYYTYSNKETEILNDRDGAFERQPIAPNVDRSFLEKAWKWLLQNPEIHLANRAGQKSNFLTLSEVEQRNTAAKQSKKIAAALSHSTDGVTATASERLDPQSSETLQVSEAAETPLEVAIASSTQPSVDAQTPDAEHQATSSEKERDAATSHPGAQHEQDIQSSSKHDERKTAYEVSTPTSTTRLYTTENRMWHALAGHGPDFKKIKSLDFACLSLIAAHGPKGIYQHDLVKLSGQDKRSLPARTDRLHDDGYIEKKRVCIQLYNPKRLLNTSHLILKRFIDEGFSRSTEHDAAADLSEDSKKKRKKKKKKGNYGGNKDGQAIAQQDALDEGLSAAPHPQWVPDRSLSNQIFDLIAASGTQGMTTRDVRENLLGEMVRKPMDEYIARLVECWQMSQPLYLRHLSIVRDTVLRGKVTVYIYYTFENFKKLVNNGTAFWEAVTTVPDGVTNGINFAASLDAKPALDEHGFPVLDPSLFHGQPNVATPGECVSTLRVKGFRVSDHDPVLSRQADGRKDTKHELASTKSRVSRQQAVRVPASKLSNPKQKRPKDSFVNPRGRPRKYPESGTPLSLDSSDPRFIERAQKSQATTERYGRAKNVTEISCRVEEGGNAVSIINDVLSEVDASRQRERQGPFPSLSQDGILHAFLGHPEPKPVTPKPRGRRKRNMYWPSMAAHTILSPQQLKQRLMGEQPLPKCSKRTIVPTTKKRTLSTQTGEANQETAITPAKKKQRRGGRKAEGQPIETRYLPSIAAHSRPYIPLHPLGVGALIRKVNNKQRQCDSRRNRVAPLSKKGKAAGLHYHYLPSIAAHSGTFISQLLAPTEAHVNAKEASDVASQLMGKNEPSEYPPINPDVHYLPSAFAHASSFHPPSLTLTSQHGKTTKPPGRPRKQPETPLILRSHPAGLQTPQRPPIHGSLHETPPWSLSPHPEGHYPGWIKFMSKYYEAQLTTMPRLDDGVFAGETQIRRKRHCEPAGYRPRYFKVIVFKCARLRNLAWFRARPEHTNRAQSTQVLEHRQDQSPVQSLTDHGVAQLLAAAVTNTSPQPIPSVERPSNVLPYPPQSSSVTPSTRDVSSSLVVANSSANGIKRKRHRSDDMGRDVAPLNPSLQTPNGESSLSKQLSRLPHAVGPSDSMMHSVEEESSAKTENLNLQNVQTGFPSLADSSDYNSNKDASPIARTSTVAVEEATPSIGQLALHAPHYAVHGACNRPSVPKRRSQFDTDSQVLAGTATAGHAMDRAIVVEETLVQVNGALSPIADTVDTQTSPGEPRATLLDTSHAQTSPFFRTIEQCEPIDGEITTQTLTLPGTSTTEHNFENINVDAPSRTDCEPIQLLGPTIHKRQVDNGEEDSTPMTRPSKRPRTESKSISDQPSFTKMRRKDGSLAMLRRNIVMDVVEKCGGMIGGDKEMARPFTVEWKRRGLDGTPDENTIRNAINTLIGDGMLRKDCFAFKNKHGKKVMKGMLTLPSVDLNGPRFKDFWTSTMAYYPRYFYPSSLMLEEDYVNSDGQRIMVGKNRAAEATLAAMKAEEQVQDEQNQQQEADTEAQHEGVDGQTTDMASGPLRRVPYVEYTPPSHRKRSPARRRRRRVEKKPPEKTATQPSLPLPESSKFSAPWDLTWLPTEYAFSEDNYEVDRPTIVEPTIRHEPRRSHARYGRLLSPLESEEDVDIEAFDDPDQSTLATGDTPVYLSPYTPYATRDESGQAVRKMRRLLPMPSISEDSSSVPLLEHPQLTFVTEQPRIAQLGQQGSIVNFMDAVHYFHQTTGTFSVSFSGFGPPRQINKTIGTCSRAYSWGPRRFHPEFPKPRGPRNILPRRSLDAEDTQFEKEVDAALQWELETEGLQDVGFKNFSFVNHAFSHDHTTAETGDAKMDLMKEVRVSSDKGRCYSRKLPSLSEARGKTGSSIFSTGNRKISTAAAEALKRIEKGAPLKRRRLTSLVESTSQDKTSAPVPLNEDSRPTKLRRIRGPRDSKSLGNDGEMRLLTAVLVIRTLTGGLERQIDWVLVFKAFEPHEPHMTQMFIHRRWNYVLQRHKLMLPKMESDFQDLFAEAYQEGSIPPLDYDNLGEYNWKWLIEWTMGKLDTAKRSLPDLPKARGEFDNLYTLTDTSELDISEYYGLTAQGQTVDSRAKLIDSRAWVYPVDQNRQPTSFKDQEQLDVAKTWIRANIITPEDTYNPALAREKLSAIPTETVEDALKQLLIDKVLSQENKGRLIPGRNYDISEQFLARLKKPLLPTHFHRAASFKAQLDRKFSSQKEEPVMYSPNADDGEMLAIINLLAHKRITIQPIDVPANKWGHTDGGYESRHMDKGRLDFQMQLRPSTTYVADNPLLPPPAPPAQHLDDAAAKIPLWYDIHGAFVPIMWEMLLAAVLAVLAVRPGVGAEAIERVLRPMVGKWEVELVLEWLVEAKAAKKAGDGYVLEEWWWLVLGREADKGEAVDAGIIGDAADTGDATGSGEGGDTADAGDIGNTVEEVTDEEVGQGAEEQRLNEGKGGSVGTDDTVNMDIGAIAEKEEEKEKEKKKDNQNMEETEEAKESSGQTSEDKVDLIDVPIMDA